jgi:PAS domain S-box-containing protein
LPQEHDLISALLEVSPALVIILDRQGRIVRFNHACEQITGYSFSEVDGKLFWDLFLIPEQIQQTKVISQGISTGQFPNYSENYWKLKSGSQRLIGWSQAAVVNAVGEISHVIVTGIDLTEYKRAELALQQYQQKLEDLVQARTVQLAKANAKLSQEILEHQRAGEELRKTRMELEKRVMERNAELSKINRSLRREIAEHKQTEQALRESEARLRAIANAIPDVLLVLDEDGRYAEILTSQPQLLYRDPASLKGKLMSEVLPLHLTERFLPVIRQTLLTKQSQVVEYELRIAKVGQRFYEARTAPIETSSVTKPAIVVVARDITQRKLTEEKLRQAQKMEAIGQLTGGVAHDFNNLLAVVLGNLELLDEELDEREDLRDLVRRALEAADRGAMLTQRLLAFSRRQPLQPKSTDLNQLVLNMTDLLRRTLGETIQIKTVLANDLLPTLIDPTQFETALLNLALNARDAMPKGGTLTIETANRWLDEDYARTQLYYLRTGQYVMLAVSDTGIGMPREVLEHAFEPFFTTKEIGKGSGLGLSMVYGLVRQSGGYINIYSEIGKGTTVRIYLPWAQASMVAVAEAQEAEANLPRGNAETILVVEDDAHVRQLAVSMLSSLGYHTLEAENASMALKILDEQPRVTLLFTDIVLPGGIDGVELAREARHRYPGLKVLFTSGYTESAQIDNDLGDGIELLAKPYRKNNLASKLGTILGHN